MDSGLEQAAQAIREQRSQAGLHAFEEKYGELLPLLRVSKVDYWVVSDREPEMALYFADEQDRTYRRRFGLRPDGQVFTAAEGDFDTAALTVQLADAADAWRQSRKSDHRRANWVLLVAAFGFWGMLFFPVPKHDVTQEFRYFIRSLLVLGGLVSTAGLINSLLDGRVKVMNGRLQWLKQAEAEPLS